MPAREYICEDCGTPAREWSFDYMTTAELWLSVMPYRGLLCHTCFQDKIGRSLTLEDLPALPINEKLRKFLLRPIVVRGSGCGVRAPISISPSQ